jgi:hypothetical protein
MTGAVLPFIHIMKIFKFPAAVDNLSKTKTVRDQVSSAIVDDLNQNKGFEIIKYLRAKNC